MAGRPRVEGTEKNAQRYRNNYTRTHYDRIAILRNVGDKDKLQAIAKSKDLSMSEFINMLIDNQLEQLGINLETYEIE